MLPFPRVVVDSNQIFAVECARIYIKYVLNITPVNTMQHILKNRRARAFSKTLTTLHQRHFFIVTPHIFQKKMKPFTSIVVLAAVFMSSTALASLDACRSMNYDFAGADYYPSPMKPNQQICVTIDGKFKKILPAPGSKLKIEVDQGNNDTDNNYNDHYDLHP